jgi:hypothetical protein
MLQWRKLGMLFRPDGRFPWMQRVRAGADYPAPERLACACISVAVHNVRADGSCLSHTGFVDLDRSDPRQILAVSP